MNILKQLFRPVNQDKEEFRSVTDIEIKPNSYMISNYGRVYSILSDRELTPSYDKDGYFRIELVRNSEVSDNKRGKKVYIHRLVANEFCQKEEGKNIVNHKDGVKDNNYYENLEYCTVKENQNHAIRNELLKLQGEDNGNSKYTQDVVHEICKYISMGLSNIEICNKFNISNKKENTSMYDLIRHIRNKTTWRHISDMYF